MVGVGGNGMPCSVISNGSFLMWMLGMSKGVVVVGGIESLFSFVGDDERDDELVPSELFSWLLSSFPSMVNVAMP